MSEKLFLILLLTFGFLTEIPLFAQEKTYAEAAAMNNPDTLYRTGIALARRGKYRSSMPYFRRAKGIYEQQEYGSKDVARMLILIGDIERRRANHEEAIGQYEKALVILQQDTAANVSSIINVYSGIGSAQRYFGNYVRSLDFYYDALRMAVNTYGEENYRVGYLYNNIANAHDERGDSESALEYLALAKDNLEINFADRPKNLSNVYTNYGEMLMKYGRYPEAKQYFEKAVSLQDEKGNESPHRILALSHLGDLYTTQNQPAAALPYYEEALYFSGLGSLDTKDFAQVNSPEDCLDVMSKLARTNNILYERTKEEQYLIKARKILDTANRFIEYLKADFKEQNTREVLLRNSVPIYEQSIAVAVNTPQKRKENLKEAFAFSEISRNNLLREAVQDASAKQFAGIPDSLLNAETEFKKQLVQLKKARFDAEEFEAGYDKISALNNRIFKVKNEYAALQKQFETEYPDYFALKYEVSTVSVEEIQSDILQPDQGMLEYFVGDDLIFAFLITEDNFRVYQIDKNFSLQDTVQAMRRSIYNWRPRRGVVDTELLTYQRTAAFLYDRIVRPFENDLPEKLIIVPGGPLGYLPFEALLEEVPNSSTAFSSYSYWIKKKQISYSYSATLLKEMLKNTNTGREVLGFAPSFGEQHKDSLPYYLPYLKPLKHNEEEVRRIQQMLGGKVYTGKEATLNTFLEIAPLYKILHLATHGKANDKADEFSYLAFAYRLDSLDNELLYAGNLYNTELRADMVVLSACETGVGDLQQGEGILSLARGFSYAGAKSIVTTLWSIDDKASLEIMEDFYAELEDGERKDYALRAAKLDFINRNSRRAHPLFWAAYVPIGNMKAIAIGRRSYYPWYVGAGITVAAGLFFWWRRKR